MLIGSSAMKSTPSRTGQRASITPTRGWLIAGTSWMLAGAAFAQYPGQVQQDGRLFDANPLVGSGGRNASQSFAPPLLGNAAASGTLSRGLSLRTGVGLQQGYTTSVNLGSGILQGGGPALIQSGSGGISDVNAFGARVGSGALSDFRRDSTSAADANSPYQGLVARPYYDATTTVGTLGLQNPALRANRQNFAPGATAAVAVDPRIDPRLGASSALQSGVTGRAPGVPESLEGVQFNAPAFRPRNSAVSAFESGFLTNQGNGTLGLPRVTNLARPPSPRDLIGGPESSFGSTLSDSGQLLVTVPGAQRSAANAAAGNPLAGVGPAPNQRATGERGWATGPNGLPVALQSRPDLIDPRIGASSASVDARGTLRQEVANPFLANIPSQLAARDPGDPNAAYPTQDLRQANLSAAAWGSTPQATSLAQPYGQQAAQAQTQAQAIPVRAVPGNDLFSDLQIATQLSRDPSGTVWFDQMRSAVVNDANASRNLFERAQLDARRFQTLMQGQTIRSFASGENSRLNQALANGEAMLDSGDFFGAVREFELAHTLDPENPLPLLGQGHAQLAAGEFLSAANNLIRGLELYPEVAAFRFDLQDLVGGGESVDIRRSELIERLRANESPELRFLLGYLEYFSGRSEAGLKNFELAARSAASDSLIARLPVMLRQMRGAPAPRGATQNRSGAPGGPGNSGASEEPWRRGRTGDPGEAGGSKQSGIQRATNPLSPPARTRRSDDNPWDTFMPQSRGSGAATSTEPSYLPPDQRSRTRSNLPGAAPSEQRSGNATKAAPARSNDSSRLMGQQSSNEGLAPDDSTRRAARKARTANAQPDLLIPKPKPVPVDPR